MEYVDGGLSYQSGPERKGGHFSRSIRLFQVMTLSISNLKLRSKCLQSFRMIVPCLSQGLCISGQAISFEVTLQQ